MSAGTGISHSEWNASDAEPVHFLQMWVVPAEPRLEPSYEQRRFGAEAWRGRLLPVVTPSAEEGSLRIHQDAVMLVGELAAGARVAHDPSPRPRAHLYVARGDARIGGTALTEGDSARVEGEGRLELATERGTTLVLWDLP